MFNGCGGGFRDSGRDIIYEEVSEECFGVFGFLGNFRYFY